MTESNAENLREEFNRWAEAGRGDAGFHLALHGFNFRRVMLAVAAPDA